MSTFLDKDDIVTSNNALDITRFCTQTKTDKNDKRKHGEVAEKLEPKAKRKRKSFLLPAFSDDDFSPTKPETLKSKNISPKQTSKILGSTEDANDTGPVMKSTNRISTKTQSKLNMFKCSTATDTDENCEHLNTPPITDNCDSDNDVNIEENAVIKDKTLPVEGTNRHSLTKSVKSCTDDGIMSKTRGECKRNSVSGDDGKLDEKLRDFFCTQTPSRGLKHLHIHSDINKAQIVCDSPPTMERLTEVLDMLDERSAGQISPTDIVKNLKDWNANKCDVVSPPERQCRKSLQFVGPEKTEKLGKLLFFHHTNLTSCVHI